MTLKELDLTGLDMISILSPKPRLYKRMYPSVGPLVHLLVHNAFVLAGRDEQGNDLIRVYELVRKSVTKLHNNFFI